MEQQYDVHAGYRSNGPSHVDPVPRPAAHVPLSEYDIFLSHSGAQKGFVMDLYDALSGKGFTTFFDTKLHSLPLAESFPPHIFRAASTCKLGVVVLSSEYLSTKWPMQELLTLVNAAQPRPGSQHIVKILPLFFGLAPSDLKEERNLETWAAAWLSYGFDVDTCRSALPVLSATKGLVHNARSEGEASYIRRIVESIFASGTLPPRNHWGGPDSFNMNGDAPRQIINRFAEMESQVTTFGPEGVPASPSSRAMTEACILLLGIYGIPGSGKSTLCKGFQKHYEQPYAGKSLYLELPTNPTHKDLVDTFKDLLKLAPSVYVKTRVYTRVDQVVSALISAEISRHPAFIVVDNISCDVQSAQVVSEILQHAIGHGSKVLLTAHTRDVLHPIIGTLISSLRKDKPGIDCRTDYMHMPSITEEEAIDILWQTTDNIAGRQYYNRASHEERVSLAHIVRMCGFRAADQIIYLPLVVKRMGAMLVHYQNDVEAWRYDQETFWGSINSSDMSLKAYRKAVVKQLIHESFKRSLDKELQLLFLDVALFLQPSRLNRSSFYEAHSILGLMHGEDMASIKKKVQDLKRLCFIDSVTEDGILVHDLYVEFAESIRKPGSIPWDYIREHSLDVVPDHQRDVTLEERAMLSCGCHWPLIRAAIWELGVGSERFYLQHFSMLKAVVIQIKCKPLVTLEMAGLTSLAIIDIRGFSELPLLRCTDASLRGVKRLNLVGCFHASAPRRPEPKIAGMARIFSRLRVLCLEGTGIRQLEDMSSCWPQLQELYVAECCLEEFGIGHLPQLRILHFKDYEDNFEPVLQRCSSLPWGLPALRKGRLTHKLRHHMLPDTYASKLLLMLGPLKTDKGRPSEEAWKLMHAQKEKYMLDGKDNILLKCPRLEEVQITSAFLGNIVSIPPPLANNGEPAVLWAAAGLRVLELFLIDTPSELPGLSSVAPTLEVLTLVHCQNLECVDLPAGFPRLTALTIKQCASVARVHLGRHTSLRHLCISTFVFSDLRHNNIVVAGSVGDFNLLENMELGFCFDFWSMQPLFAGGLKHLQLSSYWLKNLQPYDETHDEAAGAGVQRLTNHVPASNINTSLPLNHLGELKDLELFHLKSLGHLNGIEGLYNLEVLTVRGCSSLTDLPPLHSLRRMMYLQIIECKGLTAVDGCDNMQDLKLACFHSCPSLLQLPFVNIAETLKQSHPHLRKLTIEGSFFPEDGVNMMRTWMTVSMVLCGAALRQLLWAYYHKWRPQQADQIAVPHSETVLILEETCLLFLQCLLLLVPLDDNGCINNDSENVSWELFTKWYGLAEYELQSNQLHQIMENCQLGGTPIRNIHVDTAHYNQLCRHLRTVLPSCRSILDDARDLYFRHQDAYDRLLSSESEIGMDTSDELDRAGLGVQELQEWAFSSTDQLIAAMEQL